MFVCLHACIMLIMHVGRLLLMWWHFNILRVSWAIASLKIWRHALSSRRVNYARYGRAAAMFSPMLNFDLGWKRAREPPRSVTSDLLHNVSNEIPWMVRLEPVTGDQSRLWPPVLCSVWIKIYPYMKRPTCESVCLIVLCRSQQSRLVKLHYNEEFREEYSRVPKINLGL